MISDPVNNLQINFLEGPDSLINFAFSKKFDEHLSLPRSGRRIWKKLEYQRIITSQSVIQLAEHLPRIGRCAFSNIMSQKRRSYSKYSFALLLRASCFASP